MAEPLSNNKGGGGITTASNSNNNTSISSGSSVGDDVVGRNIVIGILALQGDFSNHLTAFKNIAKKYSLVVILVRNEVELQKCDGLVIPGGESTTMKILLEADTSFLSALKTFVHVTKKPTWGTCAGCILLANKVVESELGGVMKTNTIENSEDLKTDQSIAIDGVVSGVNVLVSRNYFGRQYNSFEAPLKPKNSLLGYITEDFSAICIRAPAILEVLSEKIEVLATLQYTSESKEVIAAASENNVLVTIFHPELSEHTSFHQFFIDFFVVPNITAAAVGNLTLIT